MGIYNFNKVKGLTAKDREKWEKDNIEALKYDDNNYLYKNEKDKDILFKNYAFSNKFKDDPNYNKYVIMDIAQRDSIFMDSFIKKPKETSSVTKQSKEISDSPKFFENLKRKFQIEIPEQPVKDSEIIDYSTADINKNDPNKPLGEVDIFDSSKNNKLFGGVDILGDPKVKKYQKEINKRKEIYNMTLNTSSKAFNKLAEESSPYYKLYKDSDYLPLTDNDKANLIAEYDTQREIFGEDIALKDFNNKIQDIADINQPLAEKAFHTLAGMGQTGAADVLSATSFIGTAAITAGQKLLNVEPEAYKDYNFAELFGHNIATNPLSKYADDIMKTGSWLPSRQKLLKEIGLDQNEIIMNSDFNDNPFGNLMTGDIILKGIQQYGFTVASSLLSMGTSAVLTKGTQKLAQKAASKYAKKQALKYGTDVAEETAKALGKLTKVTNFTNPFITTGVVSSGEAALMGIETYNNTLEEGSAIADKMFDEYIDREVAKRMEGIKYDESGNVVFIENNQYYNLPKEDHYNYIKQKVEQEAIDRGLYDKLMSEAERKASLGAAAVTGAASLINGSLNYTLKAGLQAPAVREQIKRVGLFNSFKPSKFKVSNDNTVTGNIANKITQGGIKIFGPTVGEMIEEGSQSGVTKAEQAVQNYNLVKAIDNQLYGKGKDTLIKSFVDNNLMRAKVFGKAFTEEDTQLEMVMAAISTGVGGPNINVNIDTEGSFKRKRYENRYDVFRRKSPFIWQNTILDGIKEVRKENIEQKEEAEMLTKFLQDPVTKAKFDGVVGTYNWVNEMEKSASEGREFDYRNNLLGKTVNDIITLNKLKGTPSHEVMLKGLNDVSNAEFDSEEGKQIVQSMRENQLNKNDAELTDEQLFEAAKKNAAKTLDLVKKVEKESHELDRLLGTAATDEVKTSLIYGKLAIDDWNERKKQMTNDLSNIKFDSENDNENLVSENHKSLIIEHGSLNNAKKQLDILKTIVEKYDKSLDDGKLKKEEKQELKKQKAVFQEKANTLEKKLGKEEIQEEPVLNSSQIMNLPSNERAQILDRSNLKKYSKEQQAVIQSVVSNGLIQDKDFENKIQDVAKIDIAKSKYLTQYQDILTDPSTINGYAQKLRNEIAIEDIKTRFQALNNITDYKTFSNKVKDVFETGTYQEQKYMVDILKDNQNFKKLKEYDTFVNTINQQLSGSTLDSYEGETVLPNVSTLLDEMHENNIDYTNENEFIKYAQNVSVDGVYNETVPVEDIITLYKKVIRQYHSNNENLKQMNSISTKPVSPVTTTTTTTSKEQTPQGQQINPNSTRIVDLINYKESLGNTSKDKKTTDDLDRQINEAMKNEDVDETISDLASDIKEIQNSKKEFDLNTGTLGQINSQIIALKDKLNNEKESLSDEEKDGIKNEIISLQEKYNIVEDAEIKYTKQIEYRRNLIDELNQFKQQKEKEESEREEKERQKQIKELQGKSDESLQKTTLDSQEKENLKNELLNIVNEFNKTFDDVKDIAKNLINETHDFDDVQELSDTINSIANKYRRSNKDKDLKLYSMLSSASKRILLNREFNTKNENDNTWSSNVSTISVNALRNNEKRAKKYIPIIEYYDKYEIDEFLRNNPINSDTPIMFITDPELTDAYKKTMGNDYNDETSKSLVAVVEVPAGKGIVIGDKNYQPIGIMAATTSNFKGAKRLDYIRKNLKRQSPGQIIINEKGDPIIVHGEVNANNPIKKWSNFGITQVALNDLSENDKKIIRGEKTDSKRTAKQIYTDVKNKLISQIKVIKDNNRTYLELHIPNLKNNGEVARYELFSKLSETNVKGGDKKIIDVLKEGTPAEILSANNRLSDFGKALFTIFDKKPFNEDVNQSNIQSVEKTLNKQLGRFINVSDYVYKLTPSGDNMYTLTLEGKDENGPVSIHLGVVRNGQMSEATQANIIKNLILDENNNVRMNRGYELLKWNIDYDNFRNVDENKTYINKLLDDNLLYLNIDTFKYSINRVDLDFSPFDGKDKLGSITTVTNKDNASFQVTINEPTVVSSGQVTINGTTVDSDTGVVLNAAPSTTQSVKETNNEPTSKVTVKNRFKRGEKKQILNSKITNMFDSDQIAVLREQGYTNEKLNDMADEELNHLKGCL